MHGQQRYQLAGRAGSTAEPRITVSVALPIRATSSTDANSGAASSNALPSQWSKRPPWPPITTTLSGCRRDSQRQRQFQVGGLLGHGVPLYPAAGSGDPVQVVKAGGVEVADRLVDRQPQRERVGDATVGGDHPRVSREAGEHITRRLLPTSDNQNSAGRPTAARAARSNNGRPGIARPSTHQLGVDQATTACSGKRQIWRTRRRPGWRRRRAHRRRPARPGSRPCSRPSPTRRRGYGRSRRPRRRTARRAAPGSPRRPPARPPAWRPRRCRWPRPARRRSRPSRACSAVSPPARRRAAPSVYVARARRPRARPAPPPRRRSATMPCRSAACTLAATTASSSAWYARRSEWPTTTYWQPSFGQHGAADLAGVGAGSCAATGPARRSRSSSLSPSTRVCTLRRSVNGGRTTTSTRSSSFSVRVNASFCTKRDGLEVGHVHLPVAGDQRPPALGQLWLLRRHGLRPPLRGRRDPAGSCPRGTPATRRRRC